MKEGDCAHLCSRTLPAKYVEKIADQMRKHNINALLIVGGFEVRPPKCQRGANANSSMDQRRQPTQGTTATLAHVLAKI